MVQDGLRTGTGIVSNLWTQAKEEHLQGTDLVAARLDDVGRSSAQYFDVAAIGRHDVPGAEPSVAGEVLGRGLRSLPVAAEHIGAVHQQVARHCHVRRTEIEKKTFI